jgi:hypothetical protein
MKEEELLLKQKISRRSLERNLRNEQKELAIECVFDMKVVQQLHAILLD